MGVIAERYAAALYELADENKALDQVADDLRALRDVMAESDDLVRLVRSPVIGRDDQEKGVLAVAEKAGFSDLTRRFLGVLARNRRLFSLSGMIEAYLGLLATRRGEVTARVSAAAKLTEKQMNALVATLKSAVGAKVAVDVKVDPSLLGGLVVQVGSRMVDSSLRTKLQQLQLAMKGVG